MGTFEPCLNLELRKANRVLSQIYDSYLSEVDLKTSQYSILRAIDYFSVTTNGELQNALVLDQTTLSRALKPLLRDGLVRSEPGEDRRQKQLSLTREGKALLAKAQRRWARAQQHVAEALGASRTNQLLSVSRAIVKLKDN